MTREEKAVYYKHNGFNCCQSVIKAIRAFAEVLPMESEMEG